MDKQFCKLKENRFKKRTNKHQKNDRNILEIFKVNLTKALTKYKVVHYLFYLYNLNYYLRKYILMSQRQNFH